MRSFSVSREGDAITCSFPYSFRAFGRNYIANVTVENEGLSAEVHELPGCLTEACSMEELKGNRQLQQRTDFLQEAWREKYGLSH